ncbi:ATP-dependent RNA helicase HrpA [Galbitalea soli]|uniref:ATP-dependent RNA helicase HrpA n=1 Tax=Galbitalea soli TaxID=1268042 RepID=A0A7C9TPR4_9MICO|nr:ATP-dependent RNA helicase HrpA [Galbitalea soli]NEM89783.1 ATP-dependent RNA helicase HrpA [Galbitalea soli]NYJ30486.1 ATP-dependent helicase HrpA [Galbitalea soli]
MSLDALPAITFPPELPVSQRKDDIARAIRDHQVVIVAGATGSGKTTQLPKICLELGRTSIGHTQPRRLAARTIAERVAEELGDELGGIVGYQVRFTDRVGPETRIKLMTDGILLNEIHRDRLLRKYDTIIIDEAHERSLTVDFLIGYLKQILPQRPDLKVIITSATIDPESFSRHFDGAPIIEVSGRTFPVEIRYRPLVAEAAESEGDDDDVDGPATVDRDYLEGINAALDELARESAGDVLVFLSGENEIRDAEEAIRGRNLPHTEVLPLYGRLSAADQHRVFQPSQQAGVQRRIVLATNVAETSLTVPGIRYVIDAGTARISRYSTRAKIQRLPIEAISQASANQRSGRSGRTSDGIAIRLYSEADFEKRPAFTEPEILRTNLAAVILQMISLGLGDLQAFPFLQPPDSRGVKDGLELLRELGAVDTSGATPRITRIGRDLARLPIDPRLGRMIVESKRHGTTREVAAIVAGLTIQDPRERPLEKRAQAEEKHARFIDPTSDFLTLLNLWNYLREKEEELSGNQFRRLCRSEYLNYLRIREWSDLFRQLSRQARQLGLTIGDPAVNPDGIHTSLLAGLLSQIGIREGAAGATGGARGASPGQGRPAQKARGEYTGARQVKFVLFPGSALAKKPPAAVMSAELVETSRLFARMNAAIDPAWAEALAGDLVKRSYSEPHWEKRQGSVVAYERATLYGVPIVVHRRVQYARVDPVVARELFIRAALVEGEWDTSRLDRRLTAFDRANRQLRAELAEVEERTRRRDILYDDEAIFEFYDARIPADVATTRGFESWWRRTRATTPELLTMTAEALAGEAEIDENAFPANWVQGDQTLALSYRFEPGADDDGVTVRVPLALLARLSPAGFDWLVPGLRDDLVTALIKSLPKAIRRNVVPAADWARRLLDALPTDDPVALEQTTLTEFLADTIQRMTHTPLSAEDFDTERVPAHLRVTFAVIGEGGREVARSKDLPALQQKLKSRARESVAKASASTPHAMEREGLTGWDFDELPRLIDTRQGGTVIRAYPALVDRGTSVALRLLTTPDDQLAQTRAGIRRLLLLTIPSPLSYVREHLTQAEKLLLATSPYQNVQALFDDCLLACTDDGLLGRASDGVLWTREEFEAARTAISAGLVDALYATVTAVTATLAAARDADRSIRATTSMAVLPAVTDAREQLAGLVFPGFVSRSGVTRLRHLPRYLRGISARLEKLPTEIARDRVWMNEVAAATARYTAAGGRIPLAPDATDRLARVRWMLEELRVSLFAQHLGTAETVSLQRIVKALG